MSYILYLGNNCHDCDRVIEELVKLNFHFDSHNVDEGGQEPPIYMHAFPCMFKDGELVAIGDDIIQYATKQVLEEQ